jgi:hypothetical protein
MNRILALVLTLSLTLLIGIPVFAGIANNSPVQMSIQDQGSAGISVQCSFPTITEMAENPGQTVESLVWLDDEQAVPVIRRWVRLPAGHRVQAEIITQTSYLVSDESSNQINIRRELDSEQISALNANPPKTVVVGKPIMFRGVPIASISIYPLQLVENGLEVIENSDISIDFEFIPDPSIQTSIGQFNENNAQNANKILDGLVLNPPRRDPGENQFSCNERMVIMYSRNLPGAAVSWLNANFVEWKRKMGYQVDTLVVNRNLSMSEIRNSVRGFWNVDEGEIPLSYLVIVGDDTIQSDYYFPTDGTNGDNYFAAMDDGDVYSPDICVARIDIAGFGGNGELRAVLQRSILYESSPFMDETDWYSKGTFTAENIQAAGGQFAASMVQLGRWVEDRLTRFADPQYASIDTFYANQAGNGGNGNVPEQTHAALEDGRSIVLSRGWVLGSIDEHGDNAADTDRMNPFICAMTCYSGGRTRAYFRTGTFRDTFGPVASMGMFGQTNTKYNQSLVGWITRSITYEDYHKPGWIQLYSKLNMINDYIQDDASFEETAIPRIMKAYRLLGDPSVNIYTTVPMEVNAEHPDTITTGTTGLNVFLSAPDREIDPDMTVCIYQRENLQIVTTPGDDGWARFTIPEGGLEADTLFLTITHPNWYPILDTIFVAERDLMIDLTTVEFTDDDGLYASGETIPVTLTFENTGNQAVNGIVISLSTEDEWISFSEERIELGDLAADANADADFEISIHRVNRAGTEVRIDAAVESENGNWSHAFNFTTSGHLLDVRRVNLGNGDEFDRGQTVQLIPQIWNSGDVRLAPFDAELRLLNGRGVTISENSAHYPAINPDGGTAEPDAGLFEVVLDSTAIPGSFVSFCLDLSNGNGEDAFRDTVYFERVIGMPDVDDPFGPDEYGYICFDSGDESWDKTPVYEWIEINWTLEESRFDGTRLGLEDWSEDLDSSAVIELPFDFMFYGKVFNTMIVCSNGWVAFGEENSKYHLFRNWSIPGVGGPDAQIAVFWQDLIITTPREQRGVFVYYWEERGQYIVEWSNMQIWHDEAPPDENLIECQLILYDPAVYITSTGDGEIKMQYKTFEDFGGKATDNQFCTIGLKNLDNTDGLQYRYWSEYGDRCLPIENGTALLFTVDVELSYGSVAGRVVDAADTNRVMENVSVRSRRFGYLTETDENGQFEVEQIAAGNDTLYFELQYYNVMPVSVQIVEDEQAFVQIAMTHPEIEVDVTPLTGEAQPEYGCTKVFNIDNPGNGMLEFNFSRRYSDGSDTEYENIDNYDVSVISRPLGCQFIGDSLYISGTENSRLFGYEYIWVFDRNGNNIRQFRQHNYTPWGFYDLAFDGEHLYGGDVRDDSAQTHVLVEFDLAGNHIQDILLQIPWLGSVKAITYRPGTGTFFIATEYSKVYEMGRNGEIVDQFWVILPDGSTPYITGLAWFPDDNDEMPLYIMESRNEPSHPMRLIKANPATRDNMIVGDIHQNNRDTGLGLTIGYDWIEGTAVLASVSASPINLVRTYEIGPDSRFVEILDDAGGYTFADASSPISIYMNADGLRDQQQFEIGLLIEHNANAEAVLKPLVFMVDAESAITNNNAQPLSFGLENAYPNPFNAVTRINFSLDKTVNATLSVFDISGRQVALLAEGEMPAGKHYVSFDANEFASGIYFYRLEAGGRKITKRMVLMK